MIWEKPSFVEIAMNAEIGSYQEDFESEDSPHPITGPLPSQVLPSQAQSSQVLPSQAQSSQVLSSQALPSASHH